MQFYKTLSSVLCHVIAFGLFVSQSAHAAAITGGNATLSINNTAFANSGAYGFYIANTYDASFNNTSMYSNTAPSGGSSFGLTDTSVLTMQVNTNTITTFNASVNRSLQATTMDPLSTGSGQIGLSGALYLRSNSIPGYMSAFDFDLINKAGSWLLQSNDAGWSPSNPALGFLELTNVTQSINNGQFTLNGNLAWDPNGAWAPMFGASGGNLGTLSLTAQVSSVPVPAAVWLFGSALAAFGLTGRRKTA